MLPSKQTIMLSLGNHGSFLSAALFLLIYPSNILNFRVRVMLTSPLFVVRTPRLELTVFADGLVKQPSVGTSRGSLRLEDPVARRGSPDKRVLVGSPGDPDRPGDAAKGRGWVFTRWGSRSDESLPESDNALGLGFRIRAVPRADLSLCFSRKR